MARLERQSPSAIAAGWGLGLGLGLSLGCGPMIELEDGGGTTEEPATTTTVVTTAVTSLTSATTGMPPTTTTTTTTTPPTTASASSTFDDGVSFLDDGPDGDGGGWFECDIWLQDCPPGDKCMPWANDGGTSWNALRCSPIVDDPGVPGDACLVEGSGWSGIDSCELGAMCWNVDPETLTGTCVAMCVGSPDEPSCEDPMATCVLPSDGVLALCLPVCDPLLQSCGEGQGCYAVQDTFSCLFDASGAAGQVGDACEYINTCDPGTICAPPDVVPDCPGAGCCTAFCALDDPAPPCLAEQVCTPYFEGGGPPGFDLVGVCALP